MLVLTRKHGETIKIGDNVTIRIGHVTGDRVKVCIEAPKNVTILRGEVEETK